MTEGSAAGGPTPDPLEVLRAASARLDELGHGPWALEAPTGETTTEDLADADGAARDTAERTPGDPGFDPTEHAEGFEAVHDALSAVLADVDRS